jgi:histidinol-phosphatase
VQDLTPQDWLDFLLRLADEAAPIAHRWFRRDDLDVSLKADRSPVTVADLEIERAVRSAALAAHPGLGLIGEEYGVTAARATNLYIDPIDGTANFARGIPIFASLLAIEVGGGIVAGVVEAPALGTRWYAARGCGAWRNGRRIRVSTVDEIAQAQVFHGGIAGSERTGDLPGFLPLLRASGRQRGFGDFYQHVLVAEGAGEIAIDVGLSPWDIAALTVVVEEAGGRATTLAGTRDVRGGSLLTTNGRLHEEARGALTGDPDAGRTVPPRTSRP